jgi:hypothetical protein
MITRVSIEVSLRHYGRSRELLCSKSIENIDFFSIYIISPTALGPNAHSACNRNEYQKQKNNGSEE